MKLVLLSISLHFCLFLSAQAQREDSTRTPILDYIYLEPYICVSNIETQLRSTDFFENYINYSDPSFLIGAQLHLQFPSKVSARLGIRYMTYHAATDYINIPPRDIDYIYSSFDFNYYTIALPLKIGYQFSVKEILSLEPTVGIVWRLAGRHDYRQIIYQKGAIQTNPSPRGLSAFSPFSIGAEGGLHLYLLPSRKYQPFIGGQYFSGYSIFKFNTNAQGNIIDRGLFFTAGVRWSWREANQ
ncbi:MAG: hypothetical protein AAGI23_08395 [Bacteroidota bacterium]